LNYFVAYLFGRNFILDIFETEVLHYTQRNDIIESKLKLWEKLQKIVFEHTGFKLGISVNLDSIYPLGYIDHQSDDLPYELLNLNDDELKNFIFNPNTILLIDNDNH